MLFLIEPIPGEVGAASIGALSAAVVALWRRNVTLEDQQQENIRELTTAMQDTSRALHELASSIRKSDASRGAS